METTKHLHVIIAEGYGVPPNLVRMALDPWPVSQDAFFARLADLQVTAAQLNNTNLWELEILANLPADQIPRTLPTPGIARRADEDKK